MNRDSTIIQVAILFIIIAIIWIAIFQKQVVGDEPTENGQQIKTVVVQQVAEWTAIEANGNTAANWTGTIITQQPNTEIQNSKSANVVRQYFLDIASRNYESACGRLANGKCADRPWAVENFSREFGKLINWYEYLQVKDYGIKAPSWKDVVCVKYAYRYNEDPNPQLISEILSFYTETRDGQTVITDRVCEKKYKDGSGERPCPIEPNARFCVGKVK